MSSRGKSGEYIPMRSEVKPFLIIERVFLCESDVLMNVLHATELNDFLHWDIADGYINDRWDTESEIAGTGHRRLALKLRVKP